MNTEIVITGAAALSPYGLNLSETLNGLNSRKDVPFEEGVELGAYIGEPARAASIPAYDAREMLATRSVSAFDKMTRHLCIAVDQLHQELGFTDADSRRLVVPDEKVSLVVGSTGSVQSIIDYDLQAIREPQYVQPGLFPNCVLNVPASYAAIRRSIKGSCITFTDGDVSAHVAFATAMRQLRSGRIDLAFAGGVEELTPGTVLNQASHAAIHDVPLPALSENAVLFALETRTTAERRDCRPLATIKAVAHLYHRPGQGLPATIAELERQLGAPLAGVDWVYAEEPIVPGELGLEAQQVRLIPKLGYPGAAYGAVAVLAGLADPAILPNQHVLVLAADPGGACAALLFQKHLPVG